MLAKLKITTAKNYDEILISCLTTSFCANLCLYSGNPWMGYTLISQKRQIQIYGTSCLSLEGVTPKWILAYDLYTNQQGKLYCKVAHGITYEKLKETVDPYVFRLFKLD